MRRLGPIKQLALGLAALVGLGCNKDSADEVGSTRVGPQGADSSWEAAAGDGGHADHVFGATDASTEPADDAPTTSPAELISPDVWLESRSPQYVMHSIRDATVCGDSARLDSGLPVQATNLCAWASFPDERYCDVEPSCLNDDDCTAGPNGRCKGSVYEPKCHYHIETEHTCQSNKDCSRLPDGHCSPSPLTERWCFPTGECWEEGSTTCSYPDRNCTDDSDCDAAANGKCIAPIQNVRCEYYDCVEDADCSDNQRCACPTCVPSACKSDSDCEGGTCLLSSRCGLPEGYFCTTPDDECVTSADCDGMDCAHDIDRWRCTNTSCPRTP